LETTAADQDDLVELRSAELRLKTTETAGVKKNNTLKQLDNPTYDCAPARPHVSKNVPAAHIKTWTKTWILGTHMPKLTQGRAQAPDQKNGPP
jgi:hypothetical protein